MGKEHWRGRQAALAIIEPQSLTDGAAEMVQWTKSLLCKPEDLSLILEPTLR